MNWSQERVALQETLTQIRLDAQLTQADLAIRLSKPQSYVSKYESGERRLDIIEIREICAALSMSLKDFCIELEKNILDNRMPE